MATPKISAALRILFVAVCLNQHFRGEVEGGTIQFQDATATLAESTENTLSTATGSYKVKRDTTSGLTYCIANVDASLTTLNSDFYTFDEKDVYIPDGSSEFSIAVTIGRDGSTSNIFTVVIELDNCIGATLGTNKKLVITVQNSETKIGFKTLNYRGEEGTEVIMIFKRTGYHGNVDTLTLTSSPPGQLTIPPATFPKDQQECSVSGMLTDDNNVESNPMSIQVTLSLASSNILKVETGQTVATVEIDDNDAQIYFETDSYTVAEYQGMASVKVKRSGMMERKVNFTVEVDPDSTAVVNTNYNWTPSVQSFTFGPSETNKTINFTVINNDTPGPAKTIVFMLKSVSTGIQVHLKSPDKTTVTINNEDASFAFNKSLYEITETPNGKVTIQVIRSGPSQGEIEVGFKTVDDTAKNGTDYTLVQSTMLSVSDGIIAIEVPITDTAVVDGTREFKVELELITPLNAILGNPKQAVVRIQDNDAELKFQKSAYNFIEGQPAEIVVERVGSINLTLPHQFQLTANPNTAIASDYVLPGIQTFEVGKTSKAVTLSIVDDQLIEGVEMFTLNLVKVGTNVILVDPKTANITIISDDGNISFCNQDDLWEPENRNGLIDVDLCRSSGLELNHTVDLTVQDGSATRNSDYTVDSQNIFVVFYAGQTRKAANLNVSLVNDVVGEDNETFVIRMTTTDNNVHISGKNNKTINIYDDDNTFFFNNVALVSLNEKNAPVVKTTVQRRGDTWSSANITRVIQLGTASSQDCVGTLNETITFAPGEASKEIDVCRIVNDKLVEGDEDFKVKLFGVGGSNVVLGNDTKEYKIISDDVNIDCNSTKLNENDGNTTIVFNRSGATAITTTNIYCEIVSDTAKSPNDYIHKNATLIFATGELNETFGIEVRNDDIVEPDEKLKINCTTNDTNLNFMSSCLTSNLGVEIINDDIYVHCLNATFEVVERQKQISITVKREGLLRFNTWFWIQTVDGTAYDKVDYMPIDKKKYTFEPGQKYLTFNVDIVDDDIEEKDETFNVTIGATEMSSYPTVVVKGHCSAILIKDDDISLSGATQAQTEEMLKKRHQIVVFLSVGIALICLIFIVFAVLVCWTISKVK